MRRRMALSIATVAILVVAVSAWAGPKFVEEPGIPEGKALVYIYCPKGYYIAKADADVLANEEHVAVLSHGFYFPYITTPCTIDFSAVQRSTHLTLEVEAGHEYFVRIGSGMKRWELALVSRERAMSEITACRLPDPPLVQPCRIFT